MKFTTLFTWATAACTVAATDIFEFELDPRYEQPENEVRALEMIQDFMDSTSSLGIAKRDLSNTVEALVDRAMDEGLIWGLLDELYANPQQVKLLGTVLGNLLSGASFAINDRTIGDLISKSGSVADEVMSLGLLQLTLDQLFFNDTNRQILADSVGNLLRLPNSTWFPVVLKKVGTRTQLTLEFVNESILNVKSQFPATANHIVQQSVFGNPSVNRKRDDGNYTGSFSTFVGNIVGLVTNLNAVPSLIGQVCKGLNASGAVPEIALRFLNTSEYLTVAQELILSINATGAIDFDLLGYFSTLKKLGVMSDGAQFILSHPTFGPKLGLLFQRMEQTGVYKDLQFNMYGNTTEKKSKDIYK